MGKHDRNERFFGAEGQRLIARELVAVVGCGGLGEHLIPQLACLGVAGIIGIDDEDLSDTNRNRYILARHDDAVPGTHKVDIAERSVKAIDPTVQFIPVKASLRSHEALSSLSKATTIFGCVDNEGSRLVLMEFALANRIRYFDLATDIPPGDALDFGGRVVLMDEQPGCLVCLDVLDMDEARRDLESPAAREDRERIYGVDKANLDQAGPSVVSLNAVVAALAVTEFIMQVTGLRPAHRKLSYRGRTGIVTKSLPANTVCDCYYCTVVKGAGEKADIGRYI
ncbi:HesA/MoeB/ThiF family protein [Massilia putida]|uniref:HesA/MoeB/ThiF family protein n=1 Tax=Massilia putida TaxID=1141883 RepID=UPI0014731154|nr:ThiF family adenylyltransferase [Massilia putida]